MLLAKTPWFDTKKFLELEDLNGSAKLLIFNAKNGGGA